MSLKGSKVGVSVDLAQAGPQATGEGNDTLRGVEIVIGSRHDDVLKGDAVRNALYGEGGSDLIQGLGGNDFLIGGPGNDELLGGDDNDLIQGDDPVKDAIGDDRLFGEAGDDVLEGGPNATAVGDSGDGGPHVAGDRCSEIETPTNCEIVS